MLRCLLILKINKLIIRFEDFKYEDFEFVDYDLYLLIKGVVVV